MTPNPGPIEEFGSRLDVTSGNGTTTKAELDSQQPQEWYSRAFRVRAAWRGYFHCSGSRAQQLHKAQEVEDAMDNLQHLMAQYDLYRVKKERSDAAGLPSPDPKVEQLRELKRTFEMFRDYWKSRILSELNHNKSRVLGIEECIEYVERLILDDKNCRGTTE